jgi:starch phosphorylase
MKANHNYLEGYDALEELALDLIWSWNRSADKIWRALDETLFEVTKNPWIVLQTVSRDKLKQLLDDSEFRKTINSLLEAHVRHPTETWFQKQHAQEKLQAIAYFSMEFMLSEALPIYSGGLGNVAGDQLKAASDLGVPVIGVGLLYQQGYFRQIIDAYGNQQAAYPFNSPSQLPIQPLRKPNGEWLRIEVALPGWSLWLRAWEAKVGRVKLYLLDSNDLANNPVYRGITSELYGGDLEMRLRQELVLGIGGVRLLELMGIRPEVCHLNEGHAAFAILERVKNCIKELKIPFDEAFLSMRGSHLFTTHTAVPAGFDRFPCSLIASYLANYAETQLQISLEDLFALGQEEGHDGWFNMAHLAIRGSGSINAVSNLHGHVSRRLFSSLFPRFPLDEVPVDYVTNGIHTPSWISGPAEHLWNEIFKVSHFCGEPSALDPKTSQASDADIWAMRTAARTQMIEYGRKRIPPMLAARGRSAEEVERARHYFDPNVLTLGFARRFATYKRPNMLLSDPERLIRLLTHVERPVQLVIAGKAHPEDHPGQAMIQEWIHFIRRPEVRPHVIFLSDYDMLMAEKLVQGVDVWINTPRRPWEACGTSGMKVLVNGGLNLSELDGWWAEAYAPELGWALGDGQEHGDDAEWDAKEALQLYDLLEQQIIPQFYQRNSQNIPEAWISRIKESMLRLTPLFCAHRAVREYTDKYYLPAAKKYKERLANLGSFAKEIAAQKQAWQQSPSFQDLNISQTGSRYLFSLRVDLHSLDPKFVKLELYAVGNPPIRQEMQQKSHSGSIYFYEAEVPSNRPASDYCPRVLPFFPNVNVPLELPYIAWQR